MQALFIGGIKSGKSKNAEEYVLKHSKHKPIYLATNEFFDAEMQERVEKHKSQRGESFMTLEEPLYLDRVITIDDGMVLVECVSMWINNMLYHGYSEADMIKQIDNISKTKMDVVFVINDVGQSVVSENELVRKFVDINGRISQYLASKTKEVYNVVAGIGIKIK